MKFKVQYEKFKDAVFCACDGHITNSKVRCWAETLTLQASSSVLLISAFGSDATIQIQLSPKEDGYECIESGAVSLSALELITTLLSLPDGCQLSICTQYNCLQLLIIEANATALLPVHKKTKTPFCPSEKYNSEVTVHRDSFLHGIKKVKYAMAISDIMLCCQCLLFEAWHNTIRFAAGCGSRYVIFTIEDCKLHGSTDEKVLIPKTNIKNLIRVFNQSKSNTITIKYNRIDTDYYSREHIVLIADNITMAIYGLEHFKKYRDVDKMLTHLYPYQITTDAHAWMRITKKIHLAQSNYKDYRLATLSADLQKGCLDVRINNDSSFLEHVDFILGHYVVDRTKEKHYQPWFRCMSDFIEEIAQKGYQDGNVLVSFEDQAVLDTIPKDKPKIIKPVSFSYPPRVNKDGTTEKLDIFMGVSTIW